MGGGYASLIWGRLRLFDLGWDMGCSFPNNGLKSDGEIFFGATPL